MKARLLVLVLILASALGWLFALVSLAPKLSQHEGDDGEHGHLHFPSNLQELQAMAKVLASYMEEASSYVLLLFASAYLFKQTFAVPGSVFMNVLAGAVFGLPVGFALCCVLTATGATFCYLLARFCGQGLAAHYFPQRLESFRQKLQENQHRLAYFLLFLRLFPMSPNWAINMSCGVLGVPVAKFFLTVLFGLMPYNYICVQTGVLLTHLTSMQDIFTWATLVQMTGIAFVALLPGLLLKKKKAEV